VADISIAPNETNAHSPLTIGLCVLSVEDLPEEESDKEKEQEEGPADPKYVPDPYLAKLKAEPVKYAWVLLLEAPAQQDGRIRICRTDSAGRIFKDRDRTNKKDIDSPYKKEGFKLWPARPGATYLCFWTYEEAKLNWVVDQVEKDLKSALKNCPFFEFSVIQWHREQIFDAAFKAHELHWWSGAESRKENADLEADYTKLSFLMHNLGAKGHGVLTPHEMSFANPQFLTDDQDRDVGCFVFARRPAMCATFLGEFVTRYVQRLRTKSAWQYEQFGLAQWFYKLARDKAPIPGFHERLFAPILDDELHQSVPQSAAQQDWTRTYWEYARDCAEKDVPREDFKLAISRGGHDFLQRDARGVLFAAARNIQQVYGPTHPRMAGDHLVAMPSWINPNVVLEYFDAYRFGFKQGRLASYMDTVNAEIEAACEELIRHLDEIFKTSGGYGDFILDVGAHVKDDDDIVREHKRYLDTAHRVGFDMWKFVPEHYETIAPFFDAAFVSPVKGEEILKGFFEAKLGTVTRTWEKTGTDQLRHLFRKTIALHREMRKSKKCPTDTAVIEKKNIRLEANLTTRKVTVNGVALPGRFEIFDVSEQRQGKGDNKRMGPTKADGDRVLSKAAARKTTTVRRGTGVKFDPLEADAIEKFEEQGRIRVPTWMLKFASVALFARDLEGVPQRYRRSLRR
jgi:hypothetical protein